MTCAALKKITTLIFKHIGIDKKEIVQIHFHIVLNNWCHSRVSTRILWYQLL